MAELNNSNEEQPHHVLPSKRKQPSQEADADDESIKKHCLEKHTDNDTLPPVEEKIVNENGDKDEDEEEEEEEEDYEEDDDDDDDDDEDDEVEHSNGGGEIDRKGKGIMKDDKGKGKLIEESEEEEDDSDSDDDDDGGSGESDGDDDLSDDPLTEVDLDNILPSRTRRRTAPPGLRISSDENKDHNNDA